MLKSNHIKNNDLEAFSGFQIKIAEDKLSYTIHNRKNGDLSRVHAHSPQLPGATLSQGTALYFVSCDFKGGDMKYTENKFEAAKAFLDVLGIPYRVVICNTLPRHNWKQILRNKKMDFSRYDEILEASHFQGKQAVEQFYQEALNAPSRDFPLPEDTLEAFVSRLTTHANQHRVDQCKRIFSEQRIILWSDCQQSLPQLIDEHQVALKACTSAILEGARIREGNLIDNIVYKQEELAVDLHLTQSMIEQPVVAFYNDFSRQASQTGHMKACEDYGHARVFDIVYEEETLITQVLLSSGKLKKREIKAGSTEQQLAQCNLSFATIQPSLQKEFVLDLLEVTKMRVPSQYKFINACLLLYKTLSPDVQFKFIASLLEHPKKKIAAYHELIESILSYYTRLEDPSVGKFMASDAEKIFEPTLFSSSDPTLLFEKQLQMSHVIKKTFTKRWDKFLPFAHTKLMLSTLKRVTWNPDAKSDPTLLEVAIDAGADLNIEDGIGFKPLFRAVLFGKCELVKIMLKTGARLEDQELTEISDVIEESIQDSGARLDKIKKIEENLALVKKAHKKKI